MKRKKTKRNRRKRKYYSTNKSPKTLRCCKCKREFILDTCDINAQESDTDDEAGRFKGISRKPRPLRTKPKLYRQRDSEGDCRLRESNSSSEEEQAALEKSRRVIDKEKEENRKKAEKRDTSKDYENIPGNGTKYVDKHAKKVRKKKK